MLQIRQQADLFEGMIAGRPPYFKHGIQKTYKLEKIDVAQYFAGACASDKAARIGSIGYGLSQCVQRSLVYAPRRFGYASDRLPCGGLVARAVRRFAGTPAATAFRNRRDCGFKPIRPYRAAGSTNP
jgi:hypothetical protein